MEILCRDSITVIGTATQEAKAKTNHQFSTHQSKSSNRLEASIRMAIVHRTPAIRKKNTAS